MQVTHYLMVAGALLSLSENIRRQTVYTSQKGEVVREHSFHQEADSTTGRERHKTTEERAE